MNTTGLIAIVAVSVMFVVLLLIASIALIWLVIKLHQSVNTIQGANLSHREALVKSLSDHIHQLDLLSTGIRTTLDTHYGRVQLQIQEINGKALRESVQEFLTAVRQQAQAATRIEQAGIAIATVAKELVAEETISGSQVERALSSGLLPESYAPNPTGERYTSQSRTAAGDERDLAQEAQDNSFLDQ